MSLDVFQPVVRAWFEERFGTPTEPQADGWPVAAAGGDLLIAAPGVDREGIEAFLERFRQVAHR